MRQAAPGRATVRHFAPACARQSGRGPAQPTRAGAYVGARIQERLPDVLIRRVMGVLVVAIGARYLWLGLR
jgi:hypothetical protein